MGGTTPQTPAPQPPAQSQAPWLLAKPQWTTADWLATNMIRSDQQLLQCVPSRPLGPVRPGLSQPSMMTGDPNTTVDNQVPLLLRYAYQRPNNVLIPPPEEEEKKDKEDADSGWEFTGLSAETKTDGGGWIQETTHKSSRTTTDYGGGVTGTKLERSTAVQDISDGSTTTRSSSLEVVDIPQGGRIIQTEDTQKTEDRESFFGKFPPLEDTELVFAKIENKAEATAAVAKGEFGEEGDIFGGSGEALSADASATASGQVGTDGLTGELSAKAGARLLKGEVHTNDDALAHGKLEGSAVGASAEATGTVTLSAEEATLKGKLGADAHLVEGKLELALEITPKRVGDSAIFMWNLFADEKVEELGDEYDWGIKINAEATGQVGASASAEGEATASAQKVGASAKAKVGLGLGVGLGAGVELTGLDKLWNSITGGGSIKSRKMGGASGSWGGNGASGSW